VQTAKGLDANLFSGETVPLDGTNASVGVNLHVNPHYSTNSSNIVLDFAAELSQLIDASAQQASTRPDWRATTITNSLNVLDGETVVVRKDISGEGHVIGSTNSFAGPKSLLVFLTPHIIRDGYMQRLERIVPRN
jgi:type II secretory pathway component GspD/PulD (secretin)